MGKSRGGSVTLTAEAQKSATCHWAAGAAFIGEVFVRSLLEEFSLLVCLPFVMSAAVTLSEFIVPNA